VDTVLAKPLVSRDIARGLASALRRAPDRAHEAAESLAG
jgi:hypothetical protein